MNTDEIIEASRRIQAYKPSPPVAEIAEGLGLQVEDILKLNSNENLFLDRGFVQKIVSEAALETDPRLYPQSEEAELKQKISEYNKVDTDQVVVSAGGDQAIEMLFSLLQKGDKITAVTPTFSMYPRTALQRGIQLNEAPLRDDFTLDVGETLSSAAGSSLLVVCNPNNPTGNQFPRKDVIELIAGFDGLVLVDEAYQEYSDYSLAELTKNHENLLVLRTFSKAFGLAGLRLGYCITNRRLAETLRDRFMMPYPVSNIVLKAGIKSLSQNDLVTDKVSETKKTREWLVTTLNSVEGVEAFPSKANFVLFNTEKPYSQVYDGLMNRGIILSKQGKILRKENCLRVTVAPRPLMDRFIDALKEVLA